MEMNAQDVIERLQYKIGAQYYKHVGIGDGNKDVYVFVYKENDLKFFQDMFKDAKNVTVIYTGLPVAALEKLNKEG